MIYDERIVEHCQGLRRNVGGVALATRGRRLGRVKSLEKRVVRVAPNTLVNTAASITIQRTLWPAAFGLGNIIHVHPRAVHLKIHLTGHRKYGVTNGLRF